MYVQQWEMLRTATSKNLRMRLTKTSLFLLAWLVVLLVSPLLAHAGSPYAGNQGSTTKQTTAPPVTPVTPVSQGKPVQRHMKRLDLFALVITSSKYFQ